MKPEIPCLLNLDLNCPETCPHYQETKELVEKGARELDISVKGFVQRVRSAQDGKKLMVSASLIKSGSISECVQKDLTEVVFVEVKNPSK
jgi:hypothetical protein